MVDYHVKLQLKTIHKYLTRWGTVAEDSLDNSPKSTELTIVIPCYNESFEETSKTLISLQKSAAETTFSTLVILVLNDYQGSSSKVLETNKAFKRAFDAKQLSAPNIHFSLLYKHFPSFKEGGVGYARKLGMDTALKRYATLDKTQGIIVCLDADTLVHKNYLRTIHQSFAINKKPATSIGYAHAMDDPAIIDYELHLRYFINMQRLVNLPFAYQTVGSAMAVRAFEYAAEGGMNKRQAGEDFYFLQKFISKDKLFQITKPLVFPSSRESDRVPFGTGKAVTEIHQSDQTYVSYNPRSFEPLNQLSVIITKSYTDKHFESLIDQTFLAYLKSENYSSVLEKLKKQTRSLEHYTKQFFLWFNAFRLFKYLHFARDNRWENIPINAGVEKLFEQLNLAYSEDKKKNLETIREYDENHPYLWDINAMLGESPMR